MSAWSTKLPISLHYLAQGEGQGGGGVAFPPLGAKKNSELKLPVLYTHTVTNTYTVCNFYQIPCEITESLKKFLYYFRLL
jgi:hypothetical protein